MNVGIVYLIELLSCIAAVYYSNFIYFYMKSHFGFGEVENLLLAAIYGCAYMIASRKGGRFAQRFGYVRSITVGCSGFLAAMILGFFLDSIPAQAFVLVLWTASVCFIYPAISALASDGAGDRLPDRIGFYNMTWAAGSVVAYFFAGLLLERLGMKSLFLVPLALIVLNLIIIFIFLRRQVNVRRLRISPAGFIEERPTNARQFMHLAWFANPLCYVAINIFIPLLPSISTRLGLSTSAAGIVCSVWMFSRLCAFILLWRWRGWHYRFGWLAAAFAIMAGCFTMLLLPFSLPMFFLAQVGFGASIGLMYYSSLYYSMNASEEKGAHGGLHESMIGVGLLFGPAFGAGVHALLPDAQNIRAWSVGGLLIAGFSIFLWRGRLCWLPAAVKK